MVVLNIVGFPYKITLRNGREIVIPFDNRPYTVPDEIAEHKFDNVFKVLVPPKPIEYFVAPNAPLSPVYKEMRVESRNISDYKGLHQATVDFLVAVEDKAKLIDIDAIPNDVETKVNINIEEVIAENEQKEKLKPLAGKKIKKRVTKIKKEKTDGSNIA